VEYFFAQAKGNQMTGVAGTLCAVYNSVTELIDHRQTMQAAERRLESMWFGDGCLIKALPFRMGEDKVKAWLNGANGMA
jgi:hypothetical protein